MTTIPSRHAPALEALAHAVRHLAGAEGAARLEQALRRNQAMLDGELFPALREAMAGSDAVCIRDMQRYCSDMAAELCTLLAHRTGDAGTAPDADRLTGRCAEYLAYLADEVLPMAGRLLPD